MHKIFRLKKWMAYQWRAKTKYYLHSPFVYRFYLDILEGGRDENLKQIESLRKELRHDYLLIEVEEFKTGNKGKRKLSSIESLVSVQPRYGKVLYHISKFFKPPVVLELGTCIGLSSSYLAMGNSKAKITTVEGAANLIEIATSNYGKLNIQNIETVQGNFDDCLDEILRKTGSLDLVFFDGNHNREATLEYFEKCLARVNENSIFVFDDIYWSPEMCEAWQQIKGHSRVKLTIDIYQLGICFFNSGKLTKEDFVLRY